MIYLIIPILLRMPLFRVTRHSSPLSGNTTPAALFPAKHARPCCNPSVTRLRVICLSGVPDQSLNESQQYICTRVGESIPAYPDTVSA